MTSETPLADLIKQYENNNDDRLLVMILKFIGGHLNYLNDQLSQINGVNPNDKVLQEMHAEITSLNKFKTDITAAIRGIWEVISGFEAPKGKNVDPLSTLHCIREWVKDVKDGKIRLER